MSLFCYMFRPWHVIPLSCNARDSPQSHLSCWEQLQTLSYKDDFMSYQSRFCWQFHRSRWLYQCDAIITMHCWNPQHCTFVNNQSWYILEYSNRCFDTFPCKFRCEVKNWCTAFSLAKPKQRTSEDKSTYLHYWGKSNLQLSKSVFSWIQKILVSGFRKCTGSESESEYHSSCFQFFQISKLFTGTRISFLLFLGFVEGSLYLARIQSWESNSTPSLVSCVLSASNFVWAILSVASPLKTETAYSLPGWSRITTASVKGSGSRTLPSYTISLIDFVEHIFSLPWQTLVQAIHSSRSDQLHRI